MKGASGQLTPADRPELRMAGLAFHDLFGRPPAGIWLAPGVLRLANGSPGALDVAVGIPWGAIVTGAPRADGIMRLGLANRPGPLVEVAPESPAPAELPAWAASLMAVARSLTSLAGAPTAVGVDALVYAELPETLGTSSGAALRHAWSLAVLDMLEPAVPHGLGARLGAEVEPGLAAAVFDSPHLSALVLRSGTGAVVERVPWDPGAAGTVLALVGLRSGPRRPGGAGDRAGTGTRSGGEVPAPVAAHRILAMVEHLRDGRIADAGRLLSDPVPSGVAALDLAVGSMIASGALGARPTSATSCAALVPAGVVTTLRASLSSAFRAESLLPPRLLTSGPAHPARRVL